MLMNCRESFLFSLKGMSYERSTGFYIMILKEGYSLIKSLAFSIKGYQ